MSSSGGSEGESSLERRLHPVGMLLAALTTVRRWLGAAALPGVAALLGGEYGARTLFLVLAGLALLGALSAVWGVLSWRATTYRVAGGTFRFKQGVLQKSERSLPLERVQSVNTVQGIVQRLFRVVEVRVEAAGGGGEPEISLPALSRAEAEMLREELTSARRISPEAEPRPAVLRRLSGRDLLIAGLTSGQIGVAASIVVGASQAVDDLLPGDLAGRIAEALVSEYSISPVLLLVLAVALFAWALAVLGTVLAHAGFTLSRSADGEYLYIKRGLLKRYETTVPLARIQAVRVVEGVLRQPFGLAAIRVDSAGFAGERGVSAILFPLLSRREAEELLCAAVPRFAAPLSSLEPLPTQARRRYAVRAALPALLAATLFAVPLFPWGLLALLISFPAALYGFAKYRAGGHGFDRERIVLRFRRLARTTVVVTRARLQSRGYSVSPFQRRQKLATLKVEVASGSGGAAFRLVDMEAGAVEATMEILSAQAGAAVRERST